MIRNTCFVHLRIVDHQGLININHQQNSIEWDLFILMVRVKELQNQTTRIAGTDMDNYSGTVS